MDAFECQQDSPTDYGVTCHWAPEKSIVHVVNTLAPLFCVDLRTGNKDNYKVSDKFKIRPDPTMDCKVSCPLPTEKNLFILGNFSKHFDDLLSLRSLSFGLLVY